MSLVLTSLLVAALWREGEGERGRGREREREREGEGEGEGGREGEGERGSSAGQKKVSMLVKCPHARVALLFREVYILISGVSS